MGLKMADCVIVQNHEQQVLLLKNYSMKSVIIKSLFKKPDCADSREGREEVLWISSIQPLKQPEMFLELAKKIPESRFRMIGGPLVDLEYFEKIKCAAKNIPNLKFTGFVPPDKIQSYYESALFVVNTSTFEGFPNTFLEAWSNALPVVSLNVDPDEIICERKLGIHSKKFDQFVSDVQSLILDDKSREMFGINGKKYLVEEHSEEQIVMKYENVFHNLMN
jgi:glycosyltransferase involved in cell wall biosynthesis